MSARQIKRLQRLESTETEKTKSQSDSEEEESPVQSKTNLFALLGEQSDSESENEIEIVKNVESEKIEKKVQGEGSPTDVRESESKEELKEEGSSKEYEKDEDSDLFEDARDYMEESSNSEAVNKAKKKKNKKKKKSKKKNKVTIEQVTDDFTELSVSQLEDSSLYVFNESSVSLLKVNGGDLDVDNEYKKLFGHISESILKETDSTTSSFVTPEVLNQIKQLSKKLPGWGGKDRRSVPGTTRKLVLTKIRDDWIPTRTSTMLMKEIAKSEICSLKRAKYFYSEEAALQATIAEQTSGIKYYKFTPRTDETLINTEFLISAIVLPNHENLFKLLSLNPYHIVTILQCSSVLVNNGDKANNSGLIEKALFVFNRAFPIKFEFGNGRSIFPFEYFYNRQFYLALFKHIIVLTQRKTFFTALNFAKLLLSLDPVEDPYGVRYFFDFYCLMSLEYQCLIDFYNSDLVQKYSQWATPGICFSTGLAYLKTGNTKEAEKCLQSACASHPYTALQLLEEVCRIPVESVSTLKPVSDLQNATEFMILSAQTYLTRCKQHWHEMKEIEFLKDIVLEFFNNNSSVEITQEPTPRNLYRYSIASGENSLLAKFSPEFWKENEVFDYDILPPTNAAAETFVSVDDDRIAEAMIMRSTI